MRQSKMRYTGKYGNITKNLNTWVFLMKRYGIFWKRIWEIRKKNRTRDICMVKYSPDVTMRLYRQLLLQNFEIGMRISGEEIEQKINSLRREVGLPDQKHNTAVEYFNLLFETKRIKFSDTRKMGYEIISAF